MNKKRMLINAVDREEKRMAIIADSKLLEFNIQMSAKEPYLGQHLQGNCNEGGSAAQAAFVDYGGKKKTVSSPSTTCTATTSKKKEKRARTVINTKEAD